MGKISGNGGVYLTTITNDMIISKKAIQLLLTLPIKIYRSLFARIKVSSSQSLTEFDTQVDVKKINLLILLKEPSREKAHLTLHVVTEMHFLLQKNLKNIMHGRVKMYVMR